jgi:hypothetical protein
VLTSCFRLRGTGDEAATGLRAKTGSSRTIVIAPGHPRLDGERIVEEEDRFLILTKEDVG